MVKTRNRCAGGVTLGELPEVNPDSSWISETKWGEMCRLSNLAADTWRGFSKHVRENTRDWAVVYESLDPARAAFPEPWDGLNAFQKMVALRTIRMDKIVPAMTSYVSEALGSRHAPPYYQCSITPCIV